VLPYLYTTREGNTYLENDMNTAMEWIDRMDCVVIGPGLGRDTQVMISARNMIAHICERNIPLVIDGDGLWAVNGDLSLIKGHKNVILTPNTNEFARLREKTLGKTSQDVPEEEELINICNQLGGLTILKKGYSDIISNGNEEFPCIKVTNDSSPRRCGGQGDVLAGMLGTFFGWAHALKKRNELKDIGENFTSVMPLHIAYMASYFCRYCSKKAYNKNKRSMIAMDIVQEIGESFQEIFQGK